MLTLTPIDQAALKLATDEWREAWEILPASQFRAREYRCERLVHAGAMESRASEGVTQFRKTQSKG